MLETEGDGEVMNSILQQEQSCSLRKGAGNRNSIPLVHRGLAGCRKEQVLVYLKVVPGQVEAFVGDADDARKLK